MRDPQRIVEDNDHPELKLLLLAAKHDGADLSAETKLRMKAVVLANMRAVKNVRQSGVRRIGGVAGDEDVPLDVDKSKSPKAPRQERSWGTQVFAWVAIAVALVLLVRRTYVSYAEQSHLKAPPLSIERPRSDTPAKRPTTKKKGGWGFLC